MSMPKARKRWPSNQFRKSENATAGDSMMKSTARAPHDEIGPILRDFIYTSPNAMPSILRPGNVHEVMC